MERKLPGFGLNKYLLLFSLLTTAWAASPALEKAQKLYNLTDFEGSLRVLNSIPNKDAAVNTWIGRNLYMRTDYKRASEVFEKALSQDPANSDIALWAGRAYGRRAETSSVFTQMSHASKA